MFHVSEFVLFTDTPEICKWAFIVSLGKAESWYQKQMVIASMAYSSLAFTERTIVLTR